MPYVRVHIDAEDVLDDLSDDELRGELERRVKRGLSPGAPEPWTRNGLAADIRLAFYRRDASRLEALLAVLEEYEATNA